MSWNWPATWRVVCAWTLFVLLLFAFRLPSTLDAPETSEPSNQLPDLRIDAFVYIAMNRTAAQNNVDFSISSLRNLGQWKGSIYVLTDRASCFDHLTSTYDIKLVEVSSKRTLIDIKAMKANLFSYLPTDIGSAIYVDADVIVAKHLGPFFHSLRADISHSLSIDRSSSVVAASRFDFAMFPDAKGHYVGFCSGCEKWHTGVIVMQRRLDDSCMKEWEKQLLSGRFDTDQESIDAAEASGACPDAVTLSTRHFLFAKDYIGMLLSNGQTFYHMTGAERMSQQDYFYREVVAPRLYRSLEPYVSGSVLTLNKKC